MMSKRVGNWARALTGVVNHRRRDRRTLHERKDLISAKEGKIDAMLEKQRKLTALRGGIFIGEEGISHGSAQIQGRKVRIIQRLYHQRARQLHCRLRFFPRAWRLPPLKSTVDGHERVVMERPRSLDLPAPRAREQVRDRSWRVPEPSDAGRMRSARGLPVRGHRST